MSGTCESILVRVRAWGHSVGLVIPYRCVDYLNIQPGDELLVTIVSLKGAPAPIDYHTYVNVERDARRRERERKMEGNT